MGNHGGTGTSIYYRWRNMKTRCDNPNSNRYDTYGGRGITYCEEWKDFSVFRDWAFNNGYKEELTLERIKVNEGYSPDNCEWIPRSQQSRNKSKAKNNSTGVTGVVLNSRGTPKERFIANWSNSEGKVCSKSFSTGKYGKEQAFTLACQYRVKMLKELENHNIFYGELHGY